MVEKKYYYNSGIKDYDLISIHSGEDPETKNVIEHAKKENIQLKTVRDYSGHYSMLLTALFLCAIGLILVKLMTETGPDTIQKIADMSFGVFIVSIIATIIVHTASSKYKLSVKNGWLTIKKFPGFVVKYRIENVSGCHTISKLHNDYQRKPNLIGSRLMTEYVSTRCNILIILNSGELQIIGKQNSAFLSKIKYRSDPSKN